jgi:hypothetical protein
MPYRERFVGVHDDVESLLDAVAGHVAEALRAGEGVVAIVTKDHARRLEDALAAGGLGLAEQDRLLVLDVEDVLATFIVDGHPVREGFLASIEGAVQRVDGGLGPVQFYSELVGRLWELGYLSAVLALEDLWLDVARASTVEVLSAYTLDPSPTNPGIVRTLRSEDVTTVPTRLIEDMPPEVEQFILQIIESGDLVTRARHDEVVRWWASRLHQTQVAIDRVHTANEGLAKRLRTAHARARALRERNRDLSRQVRDGGEGDQPG